MRYGTLATTEKRWAFAITAVHGLKNRRSERERKSGSPFFAEIPL